jgi:hypothetical protein
MNTLSDLTHAEAASLSERIAKMEVLHSEWLGFEYASGQIGVPESARQRQIEIERQMDALCLKWDDDRECWVEDKTT